MVQEWPTNRKTQRPMFYRTAPFPMTTVVIDAE